MNELELEAALHSWGRYYGERAPREWDEKPTTAMGVVIGAAYPTNPIAIAMESGSRRGQGNPVAYARPREAVRAWRDPVAGKETRSYRGALSFSGADTSRTDPMAAKVERAALDLYRLDTLQGLVLRAQYCKRGTQAEKACWVSLVVPVTLRTYRDTLVRARCWMQGRLSA